MSGRWYGTHQAGTTTAGVKPIRRARRANFRLSFLLGSLSEDAETVDLGLLKQRLSSKGVNTRGWRLFVEYGDALLSRQRLSGRQVLFTDAYRMDGMPDWLSLSVSFPNYKMFYRKRVHDLPGLQWAVLVAWRQECLFVPGNAASAAYCCRSIQAYQGVNAFEAMFPHQGRWPHLPSCYTTDPQAEVLVWIAGSGCRAAIPSSPRPASGKVSTIP